MLPASSLLLDALAVLAPALSSSLLTFLAFWLYLRKQMLHERELYLGAMDKLVASLWHEIDRLKADRTVPISALEHVLRVQPPRPSGPRAPDRPPTTNPPT